MNVNKLWSTSNVNSTDLKMMSDPSGALLIKKIQDILEKNNFNKVSDQSIQDFFDVGINVNEILANFGIYDKINLLELEKKKVTKPKVTKPKKEDISLPDRQEAFLLENKFPDLKLEKGSVETVIFRDWNKCIERFANPDTRHKNITKKMKELLTLVETDLHKYREIDIKTAEALQEIKQFIEIAKIMRNAIMMVQNPIFQKLYDLRISEKFSKEFILNQDEMKCLHSLYQGKPMKYLNSIHSMESDIYDKETVSEVWNSCIKLIANDKENFENANNQITRLKKMKTDAYDCWKRMADILNDIVYKSLSEKEISPYRHLRVKMINATDAAREHMHIVCQQWGSLNHRHWVAPDERIKKLFYLFLCKMSSMCLYTAIKLANLSLGFP